MAWFCWYHALHRVNNRILSIGYFQSSSFSDYELLTSPSTSLSKEPYFQTWKTFCYRWTFSPVVGTELSGLLEPSSLFYYVTKQVRSISHNYNSKYFIWRLIAFWIYPKLCLIFSIKADQICLYCSLAAARWDSHINVDIWLVALCSYFLLMLQEYYLSWCSDGTIFIVEDSLLS